MQGAIGSGSGLGFSLAGGEIKNHSAKRMLLSVTSTSSSGAMYSMARSRENLIAGVRASLLSLPAAG